MTDLARPTRTDVVDVLAVWDLTRCMRARITITNPPVSAYSRCLLRRNYRWLRRSGVNTTEARIVLDSTIRLARIDAVMLSIEASKVSAP